MKKNGDRPKIAKESVNHNLHNPLSWNGNTIVIRFHLLVCKCGLPGVLINGDIEMIGK